MASLSERKFRVYEEVKPGFVKQTGKAVSAEGIISNYPVTDARVISASRVPHSCPIVKPQLNSTIMKNDVWAVVPNENVRGKKGVARLETPSIEGPRETIRLGISNGEVTDELFAIGDHHGLISQEFSIPAPKAGVTITGSWDANTYTNIQQVTGSNPYRFHSIHMQCRTTAGADSTDFFDNGFLRAVIARKNGDSATVNTINISDLVQPEDFQTSIRTIKDFRWLMDGYCALYLRIPAGIQVIFTLNIQSVGETYAMNRIM